MRLLMEDPRGADTVTRIKSLHPTDYRKRLVDRVKCAFGGHCVYSVYELFCWSAPVRDILLREYKHCGIFYKS